MGRDFGRKDLATRKYEIQSDLRTKSLFSVIDVERTQSDAQQSVLGEVPLIPLT